MFRDEHPILLTKERRELYDDLPAKRRRRNFLSVAITLLLVVIFVAYNYKQIF